MSAYKSIVDSYVDSYNNYSEEIREKMLWEKTSKKIDEVSSEIQKLHVAEQKKKFPKRFAFDDTVKLLSEMKRQNAERFFSNISRGIGATKNNSPYNEMLLVNEIENALRVDDRDYLSTLVDLTSNFVATGSIAPGSTFFERFDYLKKKYDGLIGSDEAGLNQAVQELEARKAEFEYILHAIEKRENIIMLPRLFQELSNSVGKDKELYSKLLNFTDSVNKSMSFLSKKGINLKV